MTTPVPTTAAAHLAMAEALRKLRTIAQDQGDYGAVCVARAALEGWEKRGRLRDDPALERAVYLVLFGGDTDTQDFFDQAVRAIERTRLVRNLLDALEPLLFGTGPRTGGEGG